MAREATTANAITEVFGSLVAANEGGWLAEIRDASDNTDPRMATQLRTALRGVFRR